MAVVKLTKTLVEDIAMTARAVSLRGSNPSGAIKQDINEQLHHAGVDLVPLGERVHREILGEHYDDVHALPMQMFRTIEWVYISAIGDVGTSLLLPLAETRPIPASAVAFGDGITRYVRNRTVYSQARRMLTHRIYDKELPWEAAEVQVKSGLLPEIYGIVRDYTDRVAKARDEADQMESNIRKLLSRHSSLAPALKEWPPLWDLLTEETKERHKRVKQTKRSQKSCDEGELDLSSMTAKITQAKLLGSE